MAVTQRKKTNKRRRSSRKLSAGQWLIGLVGIVIICGVSVMGYLYWTNPETPNHQYYQEIVESNRNYLLENQATIVSDILDHEDNPQDLGYLFIPDYPSNYVDVAEVTQLAVPYYNQNDPRWKDHPYGNDGSQTIWENGCAIVVLAMVDSYFTASETTPNQVAKWAGDQYYLHGQGTSWAIYQAFGQEYGYQVEDLGNDFAQAAESVNQGKVVVVSVGPGTFTDGGHVMLLRGYQDGLVYVNDPNDAPDKLFSIQGIHEQTLNNDGMNYWAISL